MSSAPSGRYQSRFFNFVARRSRQFADKLDQTVRQMRVATIWGAQILLYPFYALFQATRLVGRQLQTSVAANLPRLTGAKPADRTPPGSVPEADRPVQKVLETVQTWALPETSAALFLESGAVGGDLTAWSAASDLTIPSPAKLSTASHQDFQVLTQTAIAIQGVASLVTTRTLVLVNTQNQILDVLTPAQQKQLQQRIIWEVSDYQRSLRLATRHPWRATITPHHNPRLLPPIRLFQQLMAWVQNSPVAIAANLFQESQLVAQSQSELTSLRFNYQPRQFGAGLVPLPAIPYSALAPLDRAIAELETQPWLPELSTLPTALVQRIQALVHRMQQHLASASVDSSPLLGDDPTNSRPNIQVQSLLRAAINYFFGKRSDSLAGDPSISAQKLSSSGANQRSCLLGDAYQDPDLWLTFGDLFGDSVISVEGADFDTPQSVTLLAGQSTIASPQLPGRTLNARQALDQVIQRSFNRLPAGLVAKLRSWAQAIGLGTPQGIESTHSLPPQTLIGAQLPIPDPFTVSTPIAHPVAASATNDSSLAESGSQAGPMKETWIETQATTVGYVKHPLEQILEWLDHRCYG